MWNINKQASWDFWYQTEICFGECLYKPKVQTTKLSSSLPMAPNRISCQMEQQQQQPSNHMQKQRVASLGPFSHPESNRKVRPTLAGHHWDRYWNAPFVMLVDQAPFSNPSCSLWSEQNYQISWEETIVSLETILNDSLFKISRLWRQLTPLVTHWINQIYLPFYKCDTMKIPQMFVMCILKLVSRSVHMVRFVSYGILLYYYPENKEIIYESVNLKGVAYN